MAPIAMLIMGLTIGDFRLPTLFLNKRIYLLSLLRLVLIPAAVYGILTDVRIRSDFVAVATVFSALPLGLNPIIFPAAKGGDITLGAGMALISNVLSVITFPLLYTLLLL